MRIFARHLLILTAVVGAAALATGCSPSTPPAPVADSNSAPDSPVLTAPTGQELNEAIQQPIDRAKAVEGDVMKAKEDLDARMDEQGG